MDDLVIEGKRYISSSRASQIRGYDSDYLGQLCRGSKLDCRLVNRVWFLTESSLREHQNRKGRKKARRSFFAATPVPNISTASQRG